MTDDPRVTQIAADTAYTRQRLDTFIQQMHQRDVELEGRITEIKVRSGFIAAIVGILTSAGISFGKGS